MEYFKEDKNVYEKRNTSRGRSVASRGRKNKGRREGDVESNALLDIKHRGDKASSGVRQVMVITELTIS